MVSVPRASTNAILKNSYKERGTRLNHEHTPISRSLLSIYLVNRTRWRFFLTALDRPINWSAVHCTRFSSVSALFLFQAAAAAAATWNVVVRYISMCRGWQNKIQKIRAAVNLLIELALKLLDQSIFSNVTIYKRAMLILI